MEDDNDVLITKQWREKKVGGEGGKTWARERGKNLGTRTRERILVEGLLGAARQVFGHRCFGAGNAGYAWGDATCM